MKAEDVTPSGQAAKMHLQPISDREYSEMTPARLRELSDKELFEWGARLRLPDDDDLPTFGTKWGVVQ